MKTRHAYINEYSFIDAFCESFDESQNLLNDAFNDYNGVKRQADLRAFFENADIDVIMEAEKKSLLTRIGEAITRLIEGVANFLRKIGEKFGGKHEEIMTDVEIVNKLVKENPSIKKQVCEGIEKEWFTYRDIAAYQKDVIGLINMLKQSKIEHSTFVDKMQRAADKFHKSAKPFVSIGNTVGDVLGVVPKAIKGLKENKKCVQDIVNFTDDFKSDVMKGYVDGDATMLQSVTSALSNAVGLTTNEYAVRTQSYGKIGSVLHKVANSSVGRLTHMDDAHRDARHIRSASRRADKQAREDEKYYKRIEINMRDEKAKAEKHKNVMNEIKSRL